MKFRILKAYLYGILRMESLFIIGGTGYLGRRLMESLDLHRFKVIALVRLGSEKKVPPGIEILVADVFDTNSWKDKVPPNSIFVHMLGVSHPSPSKKKYFNSIDLKSVILAADIAKIKAAKKFIFLSVAMEPSGLMRDFQKAKRMAEEYISMQNLSSVFIRPWYVLGPGHRWPYLLLPLYSILKIIPATARKAKAFKLITLQQMNTCLLLTLNNLDQVPTVIEVRDIIGKDFIKKN